jgi:hypothetical protein
MYSLHEFIISLTERELKYFWEFRFLKAQESKPKTRGETGLTVLVRTYSSVPYLDHDVVDDGYVNKSSALTCGNDHTNMLSMKYNPSGILW